MNFFKKNLLDARNNNNFVDFTIIGKNNMTIPAHKIILATRCSFMKNLFDTNKEIKEIVLDQFEFNELKNVIDFFYTNTIDMTSKNVIITLEILHFLKSLCLIKLDIEFYKKFINNSNILKIKNILSDSRKKNESNFFELEEMIDEYIQSNIKFLYSQENFMNLDYEDFMILLDSKLNIKESDVLSLIEIWISKDQIKRQPLFESLASYIRFNLLEKTQLIEYRNSSLFSQSKKLVELIDVGIKYNEEVKKQHLYTDRNSTFRLVTNRIFYGGGKDLNSKTVIGETYELINNKFKKSKLKILNGLFEGDIIKVNNHLFHIGGKTGNTDTNYKALAVYNYKQDAWIQLSPMNFKRKNFKACYYNNKIYVIGGIYKNKTINSVEAYDFENDNWDVIMNLDFGIHNYALTVAKERCILTGGIINNVDFSKKIFEFTPDKLQEVGELASERHSHISLFMQNYIYIIRGWGLEQDGHQFKEEIEAFDLRDFTSIVLRRLEHKTNNSSYIKIGDTLHMADGWNLEINKRSNKFLSLKFTKMDMKEKYSFTNPINASDCFCVSLDLPLDWN